MHDDVTLLRPVRRPQVHHEDEKVYADKVWVDELARGRADPKTNDGRGRQRSSILVAKSARPSSLWLLHHFEGVVPIISAARALLSTPSHHCSVSSSLLCSSSSSSSLDFRLDNKCARPSGLGTLRPNPTSLPGSGDDLLLLAGRDVSTVHPTKPVGPDMPRGVLATLCG